MKYSICYIDDRIPVAKYPDYFEDTKIISESALKFLVKNIDDWDEIEIRDTIIALLENEMFLLSAFTNPEFYFNYNKFTIYRPEIFILDWDFAGDSTETEEYLKRLLLYSFSYIAVYTRFDKQQEIELMLTNKEFQETKNRVIIFHKEQQDSVNSLIKHIVEKSLNNFSFQFGNELRIMAVDATEKVLLDLGNSTSNDIAKYLKISEDTNKDLVDFIGERFKAYLESSNITVLENHENSDEIISDDEVTQLASKLWSNRLYYYPDIKDKLFRKGDIIRFDEFYYLIISANCDLSRFWNKNFGFLQCIPLYSFDDKEILRKKLLLTKKSTDLKNKITQSSLIGSISGLTQGPFILPFLRMKIDEDFVLKDFFAFPKEITSFEISPPDTNSDKKILSNLGLKYDHCTNAYRIACLTEPFLTQTVEHILNVIRGFGVPDYPPTIIEIFKNRTNPILDL